MIGVGVGGGGLFANIAYIHHGRVDMLEAGQACYGRGRQVLQKELTYVIGVSWCFTPRQPR